MPKNSPSDPNKTLVNKGFFWVQAPPKRLYNDENIFGKTPFCLPNTPILMPFFRDCRILKSQSVDTQALRDVVF
jgi:hypothetical protein